MLSHGAIIAREFGIPSVVGVADATRLIPHGAWYSRRRPWAGPRHAAEAPRDFLDRLLARALPAARFRAGGRSRRHGRTRGAPGSIDGAGRSTSSARCSCSVSFASGTTWRTVRGTARRTRWRVLVRAARHRALRGAGLVLALADIGLAVLPLSGTAAAAAAASRVDCRRPVGTPGGPRSDRVGNRSRPAREVPRVRLAPRRRLRPCLCRTRCVRHAAATYAARVRLRDLARRCRPPLRRRRRRLLTTRGCACNGSCSLSSRRCAATSAARRREPFISAQDDLTGRPGNVPFRHLPRLRPRVPEPASDARPHRRVLRRQLHRAPEEAELGTADAALRARHGQARRGQGAHRRRATRARRPSAVLDVGCAIGTFLQRLRKRYGVDGRPASTSRTCRRTRRSAASSSTESLFYEALLAPSGSTW